MFSVIKQQIMSTTGDSTLASPRNADSLTDLIDIPDNIDDRDEEAWHSSLDNLTRKYRDTAVVQSELQDRAGYTARMKHIIFGLPAPVIAVVVTCVSALWEDTDARYVIAPLSAVGGIFASVHTFFDMSGKAEQHWSYSALYSALTNKIDATLARDTKFRIPPDAFLAEVRTELTHLNSTAPHLGGQGTCGCKKYKSPPPLPTPTQSGDIHYAYV